MTSRTIAAGVLGVGGLLVGLALLLRESGPLALPGASVVLEDATATTLDTVSVRGRTVEASVGGVVVEVDGPTVWLSTGDDAFPLRIDGGPDGPGLEVEDRVLAVGRLRARGGRRWLEVRSWSVLEGEAAPPGAGP